MPTQLKLQTLHLWRSFLLAVWLAAFLVASSAEAAILYWDGTTPAGWDNATNWSTVYNATTPNPSTAPGSGDLAVFSVSNTAQVVDLNALQAAQGLFFSNTGTTLLEGGGAANQTLTLGTNGIRIIGQNTTPGAVTIGSATPNQAVNLSLLGSQSWKNDSNNLLTILNGVSGVSGATTLTINSFASTSAANGVNFNGVISDGGGTTALTIATGIGAIANGITTLTAANTYTGATTVQSGQLLLDFSAAGAPTIGGIINNAATDNTTGSALVLGGGAVSSLGNTVVTPIMLTLRGLSGWTNAQYFHNTMLQAGASVITLTQNGATSLTASLGTIARNAHATLNFSMTPLTSGIVATTANANDATGILGDWVTTGAATTLSYAKVNGSSQIVASTGTAAATAANLTDTTGLVNYDLAVATGSSPATVSVNTIRYTGGSATMAPGATSFTVNGLMNAGTGTWSIENRGNTLTIGANKELVILSNGQRTDIYGNIKDNSGGASGLTIDAGSGGGVTLYGSNTYTGTTTLNAGSVVSNNGGIFAAAADVVGVSGALGNGGNITFNGGTLRYEASAGASDYSARIKNSASAISFYLQDRNWSSGASILLGGVIDSSNTGGMSVASLGYLTINGNNTYSGNNVFTGPTLFSLGSGKAFGSGTVYSSSAFFSASTDLAGANAVANDFRFTFVHSAFNGAHSIELSGKIGSQELTQNTGFMNNITSGVLTLSGGMDLSPGVAGSNVFYIGGAGTTNITGAITNNSLGTLGSTALNYEGAGTLSMSGANTFTGSTIIQNAGGTIKLDFSAAGAPQNNILLSTASMMQIYQGAGTLNLVGSATQDNSQTISGMQIWYGGRLAIVMNTNGHNLVFNANNIGLIAGGGVIDITLSGASTATNGVLVSNGVDAGGLIKDFIVGGNDWATKSGGNVVAYSGYTTNNALNTWAAASGTVNFSNSAAYTGALGAATAVNTVRFDNNVASGFDLGTNQLTVNDGILVTGNVSGKALTISNGSLVTNSSGNKDLVIINNGTNGTTLDISANLTNTNTAVITKSGLGLVSLSGTGNTFAGVIVLDQGVLKLSDAAVASANIRLDGGVLGLTSDFTRAIGIAAGQLQWVATGGFAAYGADRTVNIGGSAASLNYDNTIGAGSILTLSASSSDAMVTLLNPIDLGWHSETIKVDKGSSAIDARLSGVINAGSTYLAGIYKIGLGTLQLNAANVYYGITQVSEGTLSLSATGSISANSQLIVDGATAVFDLGANHNQTSTSAMGGVVLDNGGSITGTGTSTLTGQLYDFRSGTVTAILGNSAATSLAPVTTLVKTTSGTVTLFGNNTYSGATTISAGTLVAGTDSLAATNGAFGNAATAIVLGDAATTLNNSNVALLIGGSFTVGRDITIANQATSGIYTIGGNTAASSIFSGAIALSQNLTVTAANGGTVNLIKSITNASGTNTVRVTGAGTSNVVLNNPTLNQFSPTAFSVNSGMLSLGASDQIANTTTVTVAGGRFDIGGFNDTLGVLTLTSGSITGTTGVLTASSYALQSGSASAILAGTGTVTKTTGGTVTLSGANTFTGVMTLSAGTLSVSTIGDGGVAGNLGQATNAASNLVFDGGTLQYTGASASTDRNFTINTGKTAVIEITTDTLTLTGGAAATADDGGLTKTGAGTLILTGNCNNSGAITVSAGVLIVNGTLANTTAVNVNAGTLQLGAADRINSLATLTMSGGTLNVTGYSQSLGVLALTSSTTSFLDFGSGASTLLFSSITPATGILAITNWTEGSDSLRFTSNTNLIAASFTVNGLAAGIVSHGSYYEVIPEPSTWALLAFGLISLVIFRQRRRENKTENRKPEPIRQL